MGDTTHRNKIKKSPLGKIRPGNIAYPIVIGLAVVGYLLYKDFSPEVFDSVTWGWGTILWLFAAILFMVGRDLGYMIRIRVLSDNKLSWRAAFRVIMLWEFTSAVTPSAVGGTSVAIIYVHKEGISIGKSSAIVMLTSFLDELYFIVMFPLVVLLAGPHNLFDIASGSLLGKSLMTFAIVGYAVKLAWVLILSYGLFKNPRGLKWLIMRVFRFRWLRRWRHSANRAGTEIILSSAEIQQRGWPFWLKSAGSTFLSWSSRYFVANALIMAFFAVSDHFLLFARQLVMWIMMLVMPTPGGSGFAEMIFTTYCSDLISIPLAQQTAAAALIAFLWRIVTYYPYLVVGAVVFPRWLRRNFMGKQAQ